MEAGVMKPGGIRCKNIIFAVLLSSKLLLVTGCSDGADSAEHQGTALCAAGDVPLNETPPAPMAVCIVPPAPISSAIEAGSAQQFSAADRRRAELLDPSRITVVTCGTGSPFPSERAQSCLAVFVNGKFLLFDAGDRAQNSMEDLGLPVTDIENVFLTHFHSDHIADLGEVISRTWILGRDQSLTVYGGPGVEQIVSAFNVVYAADEAYRIAHHGKDIFPATLSAAAVPIEDAGPEGRVVYEADGVRVLAFSVDHSPVGVALGYRVEYGGRVVAISGDTIDTAGLRALSANADVLVAEVMNKSFVEETECAFERLAESRLEKIFRDIRTYHIDVTELAQLASDAEVDTLVMVHLVPTTSNPAQLDLAFRQPVSAIFNGELIIPEDGAELVIPVQ
jgi:ribonuclease Z